MNQSTIDKPYRLDDPDFRNAEIAIRRAAKKARERARRFGHGVIIYKDGRIIEEHADANQGSDP